MKRGILSGILPALLLASACGDAGEESTAQDPSGDGIAGELTPFQLEHGIGPVTEVVELGPPDPALAAQGRATFELKCMACHRTDERYIGPQLGDVLDRRSPTYVLNMILDPTGMTERHPEARALFAEYMAPMPNQDLTLDEARAVLEYLRLVQAGSQDGEARQ